MSSLKVFVFGATLLALVALLAAFGAVTGIEKVLTIVGAAAAVIGGVLVCVDR